MKNNSPGWLIIHTKGHIPTEFELRVGTNHFGRLVDESKDVLAVYIADDDDPYVSRFHGKIEVFEQNEGFIFILTDNDENPLKKASKNGTYHNGNPNRLGKDDFIILKDSDAIQIGRTTLRLKTREKAKSLIQAVTQIIALDYEKSIRIQGN